MLTFDSKSVHLCSKFCPERNISRNISSCSHRVRWLNALIIWNEHRIKSRGNREIIVKSKWAIIWRYWWSDAVMVCVWAHERASRPIMNGKIIASNRGWNRVQKISSYMQFSRWTFKKDDTNRIVARIPLILCKFMWENDVPQCRADDCASHIGYNQWLLITHLFYPNNGSIVPILLTRKRNFQLN